MPNPVTVAHYRDADGIEHEVVAQRSPEGRWRVLDVVLVEELTGFDDRQAQAEALARDYAAERAWLPAARVNARRRAAA